MVFAPSKLESNAEKQVSEAIVRSRKPQHSKLRGELAARVVKTARFTPLGWLGSRIVAGFWNPLGPVLDHFGASRALLGVSWGAFGSYVWVS